MRSNAMVVDDHALFRTGLGTLLKQKCGITDVVEADSLDAALEMLSARPELTFATFDLAMPGMTSPANLRSVRESFPKLRLAVLTGSNVRRDIFVALEAGVHGFIPKTLGLDAIAAALSYVLAGNVYVPPEIACLDRADARPVAPPSDPIDKLTQRQREILHHLGSGKKSNKEIARDLNLTENTVKVHVNAIYRTLEIHDRRQVPDALKDRFQVPSRSP